MICDYRCWCITLDLLLGIIIFTLFILGVIIVITSSPHNGNNEYFLIGLSFLIVGVILIIIWVFIILFRKYKCFDEPIYADV